MAFENPYKALRSTIFSRNMIFRKGIDSTHTLAKKLAINGAPEGTLVLAEEQTEGRGRLGRQWLSPPGTNLLFSVILRPVMKAKDVFCLTMVFALAVSDGVRVETGLDVSIKWPNDLYIGFKKLGGILTEFSVQDDSVEYVILGLGLNVNWKPSDEIGKRYDATSLLAEKGGKISRACLLDHILTYFESYYQDISMGKKHAYYERWNSKSLLLGRTVLVRVNDQDTKGKAVKIDERGALIVVDENGDEHRILCGDVSVREIQDIKPFKMGD